MEILGKTKAESLLPKDETEDKLGKEKKKDDDTGKGKPEEKDGKKSETKLTKSLVISAKIPWEKLSSVIGGVLAPLKEKDGNIQLKLEIKAITETGFDRTTLDNRVKETLRQIDADIEIWQED
jgi:hypothetical protein